MSDQSPREESERVVVRDKRKIDPTTGEARRPADETPAAASGQPASAEPAVEAGQGPFVDAALLDERTRDLQRVQAEYANYRKRAERERLAAGDIAVGRVLTDLLPVLDDLDRARQHGDLTGALKAVADKLDGIVGKLGLQPFGTVGDPFDPAIHEAVLHDESDEVRVPTCTTVMRVGYQHGERLLRPAMVGVSVPTASSAAPTVGSTPVEAEVGNEPATDTAEPASSDDQQAGTGS
ncbi:MAG: nucleotide exchange factor GrpE [Jatrophihabitans sp.]|uniref:nucleotide exchange factor GrpE n=1 Tax=Jatrophihabitans sp. TaxID=1932789 RepID=UPI003F7F690B